MGGANRGSGRTVSIRLRNGDLDPGRDFDPKNPDHLHAIVESVPLNYLDDFMRHVECQCANKKRRHRRRERQGKLVTERCPHCLKDVRKGQEYREHVDKCREYAQREAMSPFRDRPTVPPEGRLQKPVARIPRFSPEIPGGSVGLGKGGSRGVRRSRGVGR